MEAADDDEEDSDGVGDFFAGELAADAAADTGGDAAADFGDAGGDDAEVLCEDGVDTAALEPSQAAGDAGSDVNAGLGDEDMAPRRCYTR